MGFAGFSEKDFDAYDEKKWTSNRFNLERMRARENAEALAKLVFPTERQAIFGLEQTSSHDHPTLFNHRRVDSQWVFLVRNHEEQKRLTAKIDSEHSVEVQVGDPALHHLHAIVGLKLHFNGLDILFGIHRHASLDLRNFLQKVDVPYERQLFTDLLKMLPAGVRFVSGEVTVNPFDVEEKHIRTAVNHLLNDNGGEWLQFVRTLSRDEITSLGENVVQTVRETLSGLLSLYAFASWRRDNDFISLQKAIKEDKKAKKANAAELQINSRVKVTVGLFSGRDGQVVELDGKGGVRVLVGKVPVKVRVKDVQLLDKG
ncbi:MAG: hypothetical protein HUU55_01205 [Myxococcales bacterium]|nr:hypothetical protein [Myxococcales bacterium]